MKRIIEFGIFKIEMDDNRKLNRTKKVFTKIIKENRHMQEDEWNKYAKENNLLNSEELKNIFFTEIMRKEINKKEIDSFYYLKRLFVFMPFENKYLKVLNKIFKLNAKSTKQESI